MATAPTIDTAMHPAPFDIGRTMSSLKAVCTVKLILKENECPVGLSLNYEYITLYVFLCNFSLFLSSRMRD